MKPGQLSSCGRQVGGLLPEGGSLLTQLVKLRLGGGQLTSGGLETFTSALGKCLVTASPTWWSWLRLR
jgi:hypothetical protein